MMRVLLDTNVVLDLLLARQPWVNEARPMWEAHEVQLLEITVAASVLTDIYYVARKLTDRDRARKGVKLCLAGFQIATVDHALLETAYARGGRDFEDDLQMVVAGRNGLDAIVTRDPSGFADSGLPVWSPRECAERLTSSGP